MLLARMVEDLTRHWILSFTINASEFILIIALKIVFRFNLYSTSHMKTCYNFKTLNILSQLRNYTLELNQNLIKFNKYLNKY